MRLSMWMIANRLKALDIEIHIRSDAPVNLMSARTAYATDCAHIYSMGCHSVCKYEDNYIVIKDISTTEAFEIVQGIFDSYNLWYVSMNEYALRMNYQKIIDDCKLFFQNPMVLFDANFKVLAMSTNYAKEDLDDEWNQLYEYGYSSVKAVNYLNDIISDRIISKDGAQIYRTIKKDFEMYDFAILNINYNEVMCGRLIVLEKDRQINYGDLQLMEMLGDVLSPSLDRMNIHGNDKACYNVFTELLRTGTINKENLSLQMRYYEWEPDDIYRVFNINFIKPPQDKKMFWLLRSLILKKFPQCSVSIYNEEITLIMNEKQTGIEQALKLFENICLKNKAKLSISLPAYGIRHLNYFYDQAVFEMKYRKKRNGPAEYYFFYDCAIMYILKSSSIKSQICACNSNLLYLWNLDEEHNTGKVLTLKAYLENGRSLVNTAAALFVHRNTLVYRMKKIEEVITDNLDDAYVRDYMKISIYILEMNKREEKAGKCYKEKDEEI
jgi:hypothetical protein